MLNRRTLFGAGAAALSAVASALPSRKARARSASFDDVEARGTKGRFERLPTLRLESRQDFFTGFRQWANSDLARAAERRVGAILEEKGMDPEQDISLKRIRRLVEDDPIIGTHARAWISGQQLTWKSIQDECYDHADMYLAEMEAADKAGPGTVELNPDLDIPDYAKHEIHIQPGGYVGDPFAGHIYHHGVNAFYQGRNEQDQLHAGLAANVALPPDGDVKRILDLGCGIGRLTQAMKERFPQAEVWGIDAGGPMVRYGHMRSVDLGIDCNFAQRLAEDTRFPDNHFDLVVSYIVFHEVTAAAADAIIAETYRILRPGGVFFPIDFLTGKQERQRNAYQKFRYWWDHRWNNEVWRVEYGSRDFGDAIASAGFDVNEPVDREGFGFGSIIATKPA